MAHFLILSAENRHKSVHTLCRALEKFDKVSLKLQAKYWRDEADKCLTQIKNGIQNDRFILAPFEELVCIQESAQYLYVHSLRNS